jgi:radical SAM-linked protein
MTIRVRFDKRENIRFSSHKDVVRAFQRGFAAAGIPATYSRGFHPHMRMSFGPPLKTGWDGLDEYMDVRLDKPVDDFEQKCNAFLPPGLRVLASGKLADGTPKLASDICAATYQVRFSAEEEEIRYTNSEQMLERARIFTESMAAEHAETGTVSPGITAIDIEKTGSDICVEYTSTMHGGRVVSPGEVVSAIAGDPDAFEKPARVTRKRQYVSRGDSFLSPLSSRVIQGQP